MKAVVLSAIIGTMLAAGLVQSRAQPTNVLIAVNISLSGMARTGDNTAERARISTRDVISAIGTATGNTFSTKAKLLAVFPVGGDVHFIVRDGTTDVAAPITVTRIGSVDVKKTATSGAITGASSSILGFGYNGGAGHISFDVQGYTTASESNRGSGHALLDDTAPMTFRSSVNGTGTDVNGHDAVFQGTISGSGRKVEIF